MEDHDLVRDFQNGNWEAIEKLLKKYKPLFKKLAKTPFKEFQSNHITMSYTPSSDLISELKVEFIICAKNFDLNSESIFAGYIKKMLIWKTFRFVKRGYDIFQNEHSIDESTYEIPDIVYEEKEDKFEGMIEPLTNRQKQILTLRYFNCYTLNKIAKELSIAKSSVAGNIRRGLVKLREVKEYGQEVV